MMAGSKLIINNQVMLRGAKHHAAIGKSRLLYIGHRIGSVSLKTEDDLRIEEENERLGKLGYISFRRGAEYNPGARHALFDQHGIPEQAKIQRELVGTESAIITSVVSVRREDAEAMGLQTKQDWERLLRSQWPRYIENLGIMSTEDIRWVAAFHVNQQNNFHSHVFSWDASGRFNDLIPKQRMKQANDTLQSFVLRPQQEALNLARTQARDELVALMRHGQISDTIRNRITAALPKEGSLKYANLIKRHPEVASEIEAAAHERISQSARLEELKKGYLDTLRHNAELKELSGSKLDAYLHAAENDLNTRLCNAIIANVRGDSPALKQRVPALADDEVLLPSQRHRVQALTEEAHACLKPEEQQVLQSGLKRAAELKQSPDAAAQKIASKLPSLNTSGNLASGLTSAITAQATHLLNVLSQTAGGSEAGDDIGRGTLHIGARILGRALELVARHLGHTAASTHVQALKHTPTNKLT